MTDAAKITVYGTEWCFDCHRARRFFDEHKVPYQWVNIDQDPQAEILVKQICHPYRSVPTIIWPDGSILVEPSNRELAEKLGIK